MPSLWFVRLGYYGNDFKPLGQSLKAGTGQFSRSHEDDSHASTLPNRVGREKTVIGRGCLAEQFPAGACLGRRGGTRNGRPGHGALAKGSTTLSAEEFVQFTGREHEEKPFPDRL